MDRNLIKLRLFRNNRGFLLLRLAVTLRFKIESIILLFINICLLIYYSFPIKAIFVIDKILAMSCRVGSTG